MRGERSTALVGAARSLQSRASSVFACALMITLGVGALSWYYAHALTRQTHARQAAQATSASRAQGEMPLPALGPIEPVVSAARAEAAPAAAALPEAREPAVADPPSEPASAPLMAVGPGAALPHTPAQVARDRRLSGLVFTREAALSGRGARHAPRVPSVASPPVQPQRTQPEPAGALAALLQPAPTAAAPHGSCPMRIFSCPRVPSSTAPWRRRSIRPCRV